MRIYPSRPLFDFSLSLSALNTNYLQVQDAFHFLESGAFIRCDSFFAARVTVFRVMRVAWQTCRGQSAIYTYSMGILDVRNVFYACRIVLTFGNEASTCCLTSQTRRSDGNWRHLYTFSSGTWIRTSSHPSRGSGGGSSSNAPGPDVLSILAGFCLTLGVGGWYVVILAAWLLLRRTVSQRHRFNYPTLR